MENDAGRDAEIVLRFAVRCGFREARQKIFNLRGTPGQTVKEFHTSTPPPKEAAKAMLVLLVPKPLPLACATPKSVCANGVGFVADSQIESWNTRTPFSCTATTRP
jgi:hypothetical protein